MFRTPRHFATLVAWFWALSLPCWPTPAFAQALDQPPRDSAVVPASLPFKDQPVRASSRSGSKALKGEAAVGLVARPGRDRRRVRGRRWGQPGVEAVRPEPRSRPGNWFDRGGGSDPTVSQALGLPRPGRGPRLDPRGRGRGKPDHAGRGDRFRRACPVDPAACRSQWRIVAADQGGGGGTQHRLRPADRRRRMTRPLRGTIAALACLLLCAADGPSASKEAQAPRPTRSNASTRVAVIPGASIPAGTAPAPANPLPLGLVPPGTPAGWPTPTDFKSLGSVALIGVVSLAPAVVLMFTSFVRINIVLILLRQALGSPQVPGNQVLTALAILLSALVMKPVAETVYTRAIQPYAAGQLDADGGVGCGDDADQGVHGRTDPPDRPHRLPVGPLRDRRARPPLAGSPRSTPRTSPCGRSPPPS